MELKTTRSVLLIFALALLFAAVEPACAQLATVSVEPNALGRQIPRDFVGFSLEVSEGGQGLAPLQKNQMRAHTRPPEQGQYALGRPGAPNEEFFQFMRDLGPGVLRLGGNSQDNTCWDPEQAPHPSWCKAKITAGDLKLFSTAAESSGWRLILGLNLKQNSASWALREVNDGIAREIALREILGIEIGNEPDLFGRAGRPRNYSPQDHVRDFLAYVKAFHSDPVAKKYPLVGPATCCKWRNARDLGIFIDGVHRQNLRLVTVHNYSTSVCGGKVVTIAQLLAPVLMADFNKAARSLVAAARERSLPVALAETNSASCGGMPGVSNAFAAAVWGLDYEFSVAQDGFRHINFHMSYRPGGSSYNPVDTFGREGALGIWHYRNVAEPLYYAMYLFARNASGKHLLPTEASTNANIRAYAVSSCAGCAINVFVINKDLSAAGNIRVRAAGRTGSASLLLVQAPSLSSRASEVRYGGVQFDSRGRLPAPTTTKIQPGTGGEYRFMLPTASAALLTISGTRRP
jgi:hypothetical protein